MNAHVAKWSWQLVFGVLCAAFLAAPVQAATTVEYIHADALGSPVAVTNAAGVVIERSEYEPYGKVINRPPTDGPGYTGHVLDAATGLNYMQQRYYDPAIGRFLSADPVTADGSTGGNFNRYWYANNNPYRFTDPDGRQSVGESIDIGAEGCGAVSCAGWATLKAVWEVFGFEGVSQIADKGTSAGFGNGAMAVLEVATLGKGHVVGEVAEIGAGVVYKRINPHTLEAYIGKAKSFSRYLARQGEHNRALGVKHEFEILGRAKPGNELSHMEESQIRASGGLQKEGGPLANKRHAMSESRFNSFQGVYRVEGRIDSKRLDKELSGK